MSFSLSLFAFFYRNFQQWKVSQDVHPQESKKEGECSEYIFCQQKKKREGSKYILKNLYYKFSSWPHCKNLIHFNGITQVQLEGEFGLGWDQSRRLGSRSWQGARGVPFPLVPFSGKETEREKTPQHTHSKHFIKQITHPSHGQKAYFPAPVIK